jgi:hypothetical protein
MASLLGQAASVVPAEDLNGTSVAVPPALRETWLELMGFAAVGEPRDSMESLERRLSGQVRNYVAPARQDDVSGLLLRRVHALEYNTLGLRSSHRAPQPPGYSLLRLQGLAARHDTAAARRELARVAAIRNSSTPGDVALDWTLGEARVRLALGDTSAATRQLDQILEALPTLGVALLGDVPQASVPEAAALPQALLLRAQLAARAGDSTVAKLRARQGLALWSGAEPALSQPVQQLRDLAGQGPAPQ